MATANSLFPADDTIYALSSGPPPAAIAVIRVSGPQAGQALAQIAGKLPVPRRATLRWLRAADGSRLDHALTLWFPAPASATGEDMAELHIHGGRAVADAVQRALAAAGLRLAQPGEFTRRALFNDRLDWHAAEGLADLLAAETESQRREAMRRSEGALGRLLDGWAERLVAISAEVEAMIDYDEEIEAVPSDRIIKAIGALHGEIVVALAAPPVERLRDGVRVVIVGPPNAGKSTLFNALVGSDAAIVSPVAGTTRDVIERPISLDGRPVILCDTAGLRSTDDAVEEIGVARAQRAAGTADIVIDLAAAAHRDDLIAVSAKIDSALPRAGTLPISAKTGIGMAALRETLLDGVDRRLPREGDVAMGRMQRTLLMNASEALHAAREMEDLLTIAERLQQGRVAFDRLTGRAGLDDMLDSLFGRFCLGK